MIPGKVGIGITTHNRQAVALAVLNRWRDFTTDEMLVVVDDASKQPFPDATFRFENNVGISVAKNKCLELLDSCEHIFLSDDDCFPLVADWADRYISRGILHLCFTFPNLHNGLNNERGFIKTEGGLSYYKQPCGCLLYIHHDCLDVVGGMDTGYKMWGFEHVDYSQRIYNAGLTPHPFMDIEDSLSVFCSLDYYGKVKTASWDGRLKHQANNVKRYYANINSNSYHPYK